MIYTGSKALQYLHISVVTVVKNLTIVFIAYGEKFAGIGSPVSPLMLTAFSMMVVGSLSAAWNDILEGGGIKDGQDSWKIAYFWMFLNCITSATYSVYLRFAMKKVQFKDFDTVYASNLLSTPMLLIASLIFENHYWRNLRTTIHADRHMFFAIAFSAALSFGISYASSWCVRVTSSTTFSMVGALNKLPTSMAGFLFFNEPLTRGRMASVALAFLAGLVYTKAKQALKPLK
jgi:GDP-mannose transporter